MRSPGILAVLMIACTASSPQAEPTSTSARQEFLREMRKKAPEARVAAIEDYARFPITETAESLFKKGLGDTAPVVRVATRRAIAAAARHADSFDVLQEIFATYQKRQQNLEMLSGALGGLLSTGDEKQDMAALQILNDYLAQPKANLAVPILLLDDLGEQGGADALDPVRLLMKATPRKTEFGYRRCLVQTLSKIREPDAIGLLIELLADAEGLVQAEIIETLEKHTGQEFRDNHRDWLAWWESHRASFTFPSERVARARPRIESTYYGIPICAKRVVFVLDTSVSMRGAPLEAAKRALLFTIDSLPESVHFDIVFFDRGAAVWQPRLLPATQATKRMAADTVANRGMQVGTASHAALNAAFHLEPEVIYFLSDGEPTDSKPEQIIESMTERNRVQRISIHTIGVVTQRGGGGGLTHFMKPLAELNFGTFQLVE